MAIAETLITENLGTWSSVVAEKSSAGRGAGKNQEFYGIKKLRELILELAVRGLLVAQDPNEEPASGLLKNVEAEKVRLIEEGKLKKEKYRPLAPAENRYDLPATWQWVRFGGIALHNAGKTLDQGRNSGELRDYITTSNLYWGYFDLTNVRQMLIQEGELEKCTARHGDLLICEGGEAGRAAVWTESRDICFQNHIHRARFFGKINAFYAYRFFEKLSMSGEIDDYRKGVGISNMSGKALASIAFPLPPLAEQHRIVAKVDELMALCDQLEQQQEDSLRTHQTLVQTLLGALTTSSDRGQFDETWKCIESNLDTLFSTESSIDELKQAILQLAVMGKLVPQDSDDEPASELLKKIAAEKAKLANAGVIKTNMPYSPITGDEEPYSLPSSWQWCRLGHAGICSTGKTPKTGDVSNFGGEIEFIGPGQITPTGELLKSDKTLTEEGIEESTEALPGDILMVCIGGSIGKSVVTDRRVAFNQQINAIRPIFMRSQFLNTAVSTDRFYRSVLEKATGSATPIINRSKWEELVVPVPPAEEQSRIIAKVDELRALCDHIKAKLKAAQATQLNLADSLVEQAIN